MHEHMCSVSALYASPTHRASPIFPRPLFVEGGGSVMAPPPREPGAAVALGTAT